MGTTDVQNGEGGIRTRGTILLVRRFSKAVLSTTQPPLQVTNTFQSSRCIRLHTSIVITFYCEACSIRISLTELFLPCFFGLAR